MGTLPRLVYVKMICTSKKSQNTDSFFAKKLTCLFYKQKKNQCSVCAKYLRHQTAATVTTSIEDEYVSHQQRKTEAREEKAKDKQRAKEDKSYIVATFDL